MGRLLEEMKQFEVLAEIKLGFEATWRIKGAFLETYLTAELNKALHEVALKERQDNANRPLAVVADVENAKIRLMDILREKPEAAARDLSGRLHGEVLGSAILEAAARHGVPKQRWAVADWDRPVFKGDQKAFKNARFITDIAGSDKTNSSDHIIVERIHAILRDHPEIGIFFIVTGDGDYNELIATLRRENKDVVLCATREGVHRIYGTFLEGADEITIEWLEDIVLGAEQYKTASMEQF